MTRLVAGETETRAQFEAEPTACRWIFYREGEGESEDVSRKAKTRFIVWRLRGTAPAPASAAGGAVAGVGDGGSPRSGNRGRVRRLSAEQGAASNVPRTVSQWP